VNHEILFLAQALRRSDALCAPYALKPRLRPRIYSCASSSPSTGNGKSGLDESMLQRGLRWCGSTAWFNWSTALASVP
jgi:hypothetical protein